MYWSYPLLLLCCILQKKDAICWRTFYYGSFTFYEWVLYYYVKTWFSFVVCMYLYNNLLDDYRITFLHLCFWSCFFRCSNGIVYFLVAILHNTIEHDNCLASQQQTRGWWIILCIRWYPSCCIHYLMDICERIKRFVR